MRTGRTTKAEGSKRAPSVDRTRSVAQHEPAYGSIINRQLVPRLAAIAVADLRFEHVDAATLLRTILTGRKGRNV
jgi:hypothetical protein